MTDNPELLINLIAMVTLFLITIGILITLIKNLKNDVCKHIDELRDGLNGRIDRLENDHSSLAARLDTLNTKVDNLNSKVDTLVGAVDVIREYASPKETA